MITIGQHKDEMPDGRLRRRTGEGEKTFDTAQ